MAARYKRYAVQTLKCAVGAGLAWKFAELFHVDAQMEMDGTIGSIPKLFTFQKKAAVLPTEFEERVTARTPSSHDDDMIIVTSSVFGDNGYLYRRLDLNYKSKSPSPLPFQTLIRCKNDIVEENEDWHMVKCEPDYMHVLPLYQRMMCYPMIIAERCLNSLTSTGRRKLTPDGREVKPGKALVVGLGGGAWAGFLQELYPDMHIDCVEIESGVVAHAKEFFGFKPSPTTAIIVEDAQTFARQQAEEVVMGKTDPYDLIFVDAYSNGEPNECLTSFLFYQDLENTMSDKSCIAVHLNTRSDSNYDMWRAASHQFGKRAIVLRTGKIEELCGSLICASKGWVVADPLDMSAYRLLWMARDWSVEHKLPFDVSKRMFRSASPAFPGLRTRFHATRQELEEVERRKAHLRQQQSEDEHER
ncbi:hypothetical protein DIPPA_70128 [Diplonema papillatum]|nr:hypothetical protein DIPPA_70128 [Diplonema papillatum]